MSTLPLDGIRVLDLSRVLAGPVCSMQLADLGADVIKVEPLAGDDTRRFAPPWVEGPNGEREASYYLAVNRGKRSICVNMKHPDGLAVVHDLAREADVVLENFRGGVTERLGVDATTLRNLNEKLVYVSITGFGLEGDDDWTTRPGYDLVIQGMGGLPALTGPEDGPPYKVGASIADVCAGMSATQAVLAALLHRDRHGEGSTVDVSMMDVQLSLLVYHGSSWLMAGTPPERLGNQHPSLHPYGTYAAKDGHLNVAAGNDALFGKLADVLGHPDWKGDPRFATNPDRVEHRLELDEELVDAFSSDTVSSWIHRLREAGVPVGPILSVPQALEHPQTTARGTIVTHEHPTLGTLRSVASPLHFLGKPRAHPRPPPRTGEHTDIILVELGRTPEQVASMRDSGAVA